MKSQIVSIVKSNLITILVLFFPFLMSAQDAGIKVTVSGIKSVKGDLLIAIYNKSSDFLKQDKAFLSSVVKVNDNKVVVVFKDVKKGEYAIAVIHDENSNKELDTNFLGIPTEYIGTSNNIRNMFGPPSFNDSKFNYSGGGLSLEIKLY